MLLPDDIKVFERERDAAALFVLWRKSIGGLWPIDEARLQQILAAPQSSHFVLYEGGQLVGFVASMRNLREGRYSGHLVVVLVAAHARRRGIGSALYERADQQFRMAGIERIQIGGGDVRFWPGIPQNLVGARTFFERQGWQFAFSCYDLVQDMRSYETPAYVQQRMITEGIRFELATRENADEVLTFEEREFPGWLNAFQHVVSLGDYEDMVLAREQSGRVIGTLILYTRQSHALRTDVLWQSLLGEKTGAIGCVGIAEAERGRGAGLGLVAAASEILCKRGVERCYIDWVVLIDFYGKLGYRIWRGYDMTS